MTSKPATQVRTKHAGFLTTTLIGGFAVLLPVYLTFLFIAKMLHGVSVLFSPLIDFAASLLPVEHAAFENLIGLAVLVAVCFACGVALRTSFGALIRTRVRPKLQKLPGYSLLTTLTQQLTSLGGEKDLQVAAVALGGLDESLSIGIVVDHQPGLGYLVFVPSVPTPASGDLFIVSEDKVFPIDLPFAKAVKFYSQWGTNSADVLRAVAELGIDRGA